MSGAALRRPLVSHSPVLSDGSQDGSLDRLLEDGEGEEEDGLPSTAKLHFPDELLKTLLAAVFFVISLVVTTVALIFTNERVPETPPLPDLLLDHVVYLEDGLAASEKIMVSSMVLALLVTLAHTHRAILLRRVFFLLGLMYFYRAITMQLTALPKPDPRWNCPKANETLSLGAVVGHVMEVAVGGGVSLGEQQQLCGDYIFSGHTMVFAISHLVVREYTPACAFALQWFSLALSCTGVLMLLLGRGHYSIDVVLAYYVTTRVWWAYHLMLDHRGRRGRGGLRGPGGRGRLQGLWWWRIFNFWERNVPGPLPQRYSLPPGCACAWRWLVRRMPCRRDQQGATELV